MAAWRILPTGTWRTLRPRETWSGFYSKGYSTTSTALFHSTCLSHVFLNKIQSGNLPKNLQPTPNLRVVCSNYVKPTGFHSTHRWLCISKHEVKQSLRSLPNVMAVVRTRKTSVKFWHSPTLWNRLQLRNAQPSEVSSQTERPRSGSWNPAIVICSLCGEKISNWLVLSNNLKFCLYLKVWRFTSSLWVKWHVIEVWHNFQPWKMIFWK